MTFIYNYSFFPKNYFVNQKEVLFKGNTDIFALTDSHQHTGDKCKLLSKVLEKAKSNDNVLVLDNGDLFKGVYPRELEVESYLKLKQLAPNLEIIINIGNNDPGYSLNERRFFKQAVKKLRDNGIHVISANTWQKHKNKRIDGVKPYTIVNRDGDRLLVVGFSVNSFDKTVPGMTSRDSVEVLNELKENIKKEKPDGLIILNHDFFKKSRELLEFAQKEGLKVDLLLGGHIHKMIDDDPKIFYPEPYSRSMFEFDLNIDSNKPDRPSILTKEKTILSKDLKIQEDLHKVIFLAEQELSKEMAPAVLDLTMPKLVSNSRPSNFGTLVADGMKDSFKTDIAMFSRGIITKSLRKNPDKKLTLFDLRSAIPGAKMQKIILTPDILKKAFENALKDQISPINKRGLQYSGNMKIVRKINNDHNKDKSIKNKIVQIYIDEKPLFNEQTGKALNPDQKISCIIDYFIGSGNQEFNMLENLPKEEVFYEGKEISATDILAIRLNKLAQENPEITNYPTAKMVDIWI